MNGNVSNGNRHIGIDILKLISAVGVICLHQNIPGELGRIIVVISRCAVPIFFLLIHIWH